MNDIIREGLNAAQCAAAGKAKLPAVVLVDRAGTRVKRYIVFELGEYAAWNGLGPSMGAEIEETTGARPRP